MRLCPRACERLGVRCLVEPLRPSLNVLCCNILDDLVQHQRFYERMGRALVLSLSGQRPAVRVEVLKMAMIILFRYGPCSVCDFLDMARCRPIQNAGDDVPSVLVRQFIVHILTAPAVVLHVQTMVPEVS